MSVRAAVTRRRAGLGGARELGVLGGVGVVAVALLSVLVLTAAPAWAAGPAILAYSPPAGEPLSQQMSPLTKPWVKFSEPVDPTTVTSSTFYMMKQGAAVKVPAGFEYGPSPNVVKLVPVAPLEGGAVYEVTITVGVRDLDGEALSTPWSWAFRVVPDEPVGVFVDVPPGTTYYAAIQGLYEAGIVDGSDGPMGREFHPANPIWRQQFAKMIVGAFNLPVTEDMTSPFTDMGVDSEGSLYPHEYVAAAFANGITTGMTATSFGMYREITRAQVITMGVRALENLHPGVLTAPPAEYASTWGSGFSPIHGRTARIAEYNGLLNGLGTDAGHPAGDLGGLSPWGVMPRGEVAQFLWNVIALLP